RDRVRSLSLLCTFARGKSAALLTFGMVWVGLRTRIGTRRMRRRAVLELVMPPGALTNAGPDPPAAGPAALFGHHPGNRPAVTSKQLAAMRKYDATPRLVELAGLPTLVVNAVHDRIAPPAVGRALAAGIPGARYVEIADASHGVPIQQPDHINALLREHF